MGYSIGVATVKTALLESNPFFIGLIASTGGAETTIYKWTIDFTSIEKLHVSRYLADGGGAASVLKIDIGGVNKITENNNGLTYSAIDTSAITGESSLEIKGDVTNAAAYIRDLTITAEGA